MWTHTHMLWCVCVETAGQLVEVGPFLTGGPWGSNLVIGLGDKRLPRWTSSPACTPPYCLRYGLSMNPELTEVAWPTSPRDPLFCLPSTGDRVFTWDPGIQTRSWHLCGKHFTIRVSSRPGEKPFYSYFVNDETRARWASLIAVGESGCLRPLTIVGTCNHHTMLLSRETGLPGGRCLICEYLPVVAGMHTTRQTLWNSATFCFHVRILETHLPPWPKAKLLGFKNQSQWWSAGP